MKTNKLILGFIIIAVIAILGLGSYSIYSNLQQQAKVDEAARILQEANSKAPPQPAVEDTQIDINAEESDPTIPNGCRFVSAEDVLSSFELTVKEGVSVRSPIPSGTSCLLKNSDSTVGIIVQTFPETDGAYNPSSWEGTTEVTGIGSKAFVQTPTSNGVANAESVKNGTIIYVNVYSKTTYTSEQVKTFLAAITEKFK